jgi:AraC-like DNA-binding protein
MDDSGGPSDSALQLEDFRAAVRSHIARLSVTPADKRTFSASVKQSCIGFLDLVRLDCGPILVERTPHDIAGDQRSDFMLALQIQGNGKTRQAGREVTLGPGDFSIVDSAMPYALEFDGPVRRLVMRLPREEVRRRGGLNQNLCCLAYRGSAGLSGMASNMVLSLDQHGGGVARSLHQTLATKVLDLILFSQAEDATEGTALSQSNGKTLQRLRSVVLANLADPELSAEKVAALAGISVRYVHKLFRSSGVSLNRLIREERLAACHACLTNPAHANRSITEIALSNGFNDSGYFSHLFAAHYGTSPSRLRGNRQMTQ